MAAYKDKITPERLIEAAEAAIAAADEYSAMTGKPRPYPLNLLGSPDQPDCLCNFSREEIAEACSFLVRLGEFEMPGDQSAEERRTV